MPQIHLEIPDELLGSQGDLGPAEVGRMAREALLVRLYALGRISSGRCAELLQLSRRAFLDLAGNYGVSIFAEPDDLQREAACGISIRD